MLKVHTAESQEALDEYIRQTMKSAQNLSFVQPDYGRVSFPANFVIVTNPHHGVATIEFLY